MKRLFISAIALGSLIISLAFIAPEKESYYLWTDYASVHDSHGFNVLNLQYGVNPEGKVKWKLTNLTGKTLYSIMIGDQTYHLTNGEMRRLPARDLAYSLTSGQSAETDAIYICSAIGHRTRSNELVVHINSMGISTPRVKFTTDSSALFTQCWTDYGTEFIY